MFSRMMLDSYKDRDMKVKLAYFLLKIKVINQYQWKHTIDIVNMRSILRDSK